MVEHPPAARRAILRRLRTGEHPADLIADARKVGDPGHAATALLHLAGDMRLPASKSASLIREATRLLKEVDRPGRFAEAWGEALAVCDGLDRGPEASHALEDMEAATAAAIRKMADGQWVTDAILAVLPYVGEQAREALLVRGLNNPGGERAVAKAIVDLEPSLVAVVKEHGSPEILAAAQARVGSADQAVDAAWTIEETEERREAMRVLIWQMESVDALMSIGASADAQSPTDRCSIWTMIAARLDRLKRDPSQAFGAAKKALRELTGKEAVKAHRKLAQAMERAGQEPPEPPVVEEPENDAPADSNPDTPADAAASDVEAPSVADAPTDDGAEAAPESQVPSSDESSAEAAPESQVPSSDEPVDEPAAEPSEPSDPQPTSPIASTPKLGRHTFALVDGYTGSLGPAHLRAVARAAPLCAAFNLDLALVGFPGELSTIVDLVEVDSNVGEGGGYAKQLLQQGRLSMLPLEGALWPGKPIATTPSPAPEKAGELAGERICLLVGLGKQGLPRRLLNEIDTHHELTGQGISLETATAMGILADRLGRL